MALNPNALETIAKLKSFVSIPSSETSFDDLLEDFINEASRLIENYCGRKFIAENYVHYFDGTRRNEILLRQWPVTAITKVYEDYSREFTATTELDSTSYQIVKNEHDEGISLQRFGQNFGSGEKIIKVEYTAGYADIDSLPSDLRLACKITASFYYLKQQQKDWQFSNKTKGDENITLVQGIPESAIQILENYKRLEIIEPPASIKNR